MQNEMTIMQIVCTNNNGISYLQVQESHYEISGGKSRQRRRVVKNLGPLSRFDDGEPDFLNRLRASLREGNPIIPELNDLIDASFQPKVKDEEIISKYHGLSAYRIQDALASFQADTLPGGYYRLTKQNEDLTLILQSFGVKQTRSPL